MQKWYQKATVQAAIVVGIFTILGAIVTGGFGLFDSSSGSSTVYQANRDINIVQGEKAKHAAVHVFLNLLRKSLDAASYSYGALKTVPYEFDKSVNYDSLSPYLRPFNLRRFQATRLNNYGLYMSLPPDSAGVERNHVVWLKIMEPQVDKSQLHQVFSDTRLIDRFFFLIEANEIAMKRLMEFWEATLEGKPDHVPDWNLEKIDWKDYTSAELRSIHAAKFFQAYSKIERMIKEIEQEFAHSIKYTRASNQEINVGIWYNDPDTIGINRIR